MPPHRLAWRVGTLLDARRETETARTLVLDVPGWPGHLAGQHVILRLTAEDGYTAQRSYSLASPPDGDRIEVTVQRLADGEVSPYLTDIMEPGDRLEVRGPVGGWFVWDPASRAPVQLVAGGSGIVPLMSMIRAVKGTVPIRLLYSARTPADVIYAGELARRARHPSLAVTYVLTRVAPVAPVAPDSPVAASQSRGLRGSSSAGAASRGLRGSPPEAALRGWAGEADGVVRYGRISLGFVSEAMWSPDAKPDIFACGPSGFVEAASGLLVAAGHDAAAIKTERFGPTS